MEYPIHMPVFAPGHPLYLQLYQHLAREIQQGRPGPGKKLPSKRRLCALLGVSMSTVEGAYSLLLAEGYVKSLPRSGYVAAQLHDVPVQSVPDLPAPPEPPSQWRYDCSTSAVDTSVFPFSSWARINKDSVYQNPGLLQPGHPQGDEPLRVALAGLLAQYRGVRCSPEQIVVGAGTEYLYNLLVQLLGRERIYGVEDPGYPKAGKVYGLHGARCVPLALDESGVPVEAVERSGVQVVHLSPSHQFPSGVVMPIARRQSLLRWAEEEPGRYLIEDDYDSEFRFTGRPIPPLQNIDRAGRVIYMNTFSRSLAPSLRISYMVLPPALLERYQRTLGFYSCTVPAMEQYTLARFLSEGYFETHVNRMRGFYRGRRDQVLDALSRSPLAGRYQVRGEDAGLHFLLRLETERDDRSLARAAEERQIRLSFLSDYGGGESHVLVVSYPGIELARLPEALAHLAELL